MSIIMFLPSWTTGSRPWPLSPLPAKAMMDGDHSLSPQLGLGRQRQALFDKKPHRSRNATSCILPPGRKPGQEWGENGRDPVLREATGKPRNQRRKNLLHDYFFLVELQKKSQALSSMKSYWDNRDGIATADSNVYKGIVCRCRTA